MANVVREYPQDNGDGTISVVQEMDDGTYVVVRTFPKEDAAGGGGVSDDEIIRWANSLGRPDLVAWAKTFVAKNGRLPTSLSELPGRLPTSPSELPGGNFNYSDYYRSIVESNQKQLDWLKEQFYAAQGWEKEKWAQQYALAVAELKSNVAKLAASLKGPENIFSYLQYTNAGKDIFSGLGGSEASPAFGAPTGYSKPSSIEQILRDLGIKEIPGSTIPPANDTSGLTDDAALDWIWSKRPDLKGFFETRGGDVSTPDKQRAAVREWIGGVDPRWKGMTPQQVAGKLGYVAPATEKPAIQQGGGESMAQRQQAPSIDWMRNGGRDSFKDQLIAGPLGSPAQRIYREPVQMTGPAPNQGVILPPPGAYDTAMKTVSGLGPPDDSGDWEFVNFADASLGKPQPGMFYQQVITPGWRNKRTGETRAASREQPPGTGAPYFGPRERSAPVTTGTFSIPQAIRDAYQQGVGGTQPVTGGLLNWQDDPRPHEIAKPDNIDQATWDALGPTAQALFAKQGYLVPNPHQINAAVWDSYSDSQKAAALNAAEKGYTPSGAWYAGDFLRQLNAARPTGFAPRQVSFDWGQKRPLL